jgi:hypothetical protein
MGDPPGVVSGPQVGAMLPEIKAIAITGPMASKEFALSASIKDRPAMVVIGQRPSREVRLLLRTLDWYAGTVGPDALQTHHLVTERPGTTREGMMQELALAAKSALKVKAPLSFLDAKNAEILRLHDKTALTVLFIKEGKVIANVALLNPNDADTARVIAAASNLIGKAPPTLQVTANKENVVASKLEGTWQANAELWKRLNGNDKPEKAIISFKSDPTVAAKIPIKYVQFLDGPIFMAGVMRRDERENHFVITTFNGNTHLFYFRPRGGDPLGDAESFNLFIGVARDSKNDLLFIGGDFNNQPFSAWERVK